MSSRTNKRVLADMLEDLSQQNFDKFCRQLLDRREEPRVRRNRVEGKSFLEIADVLVSTFTEARAPEVAAEILRGITCNEEARRLVEETSGQSSQPGPSGTARASAGAAGGATMAQGEHFVDRHRARLTDRVCNIAAILDDLLQEKVITPASYDEILTIPANREKMRKLYSGPLNSAGPCGKDVFYNILVKYERYLIEELSRQM